ncbi:hypothetical protein [Kribbella flavida]|uniref:hypothetical protein n=1 Tax=Kribbella flavida TaxID=182640 RepID=UPI00019BE98D|nr:hypothetical protein [Kribbella flavida]
MIITTEHVAGVHLIDPITTPGRDDDPDVLPARALIGDERPGVVRRGRWAPR